MTTKSVFIVDLPPEPPAHVVHAEYSRRSGAERFDGLWFVKGGMKPPEPPEHHPNDDVEENPPSGRSVSVGEGLNLTDAVTVKIGDLSYRFLPKEE